MQLGNLAAMYMCMYICSISATTCWCMHVCMYGVWMISLMLADGWMDGWMDGRTDGSHDISLHAGGVNWSHVMLVATVVLKLWIALQSKRRRARPAICMVGRVTLLET